MFASAWWSVVNANFLALWFLVVQSASTVRLFLLGVFGYGFLRYRIIFSIIEQFLIIKGLWFGSHGLFSTLPGWDRRLYSLWPMALSLRGRRRKESSERSNTSGMEDCWSIDDPNLDVICYWLRSIEVSAEKPPRPFLEPKLPEESSPILAVLSPLAFSFAFAFAYILSLFKVAFALSRGFSMMPLALASSCFKCCIQFLCLLLISSFTVISSLALTWKCKNFSSFSAQLSYRSDI